MKCFYCVGALFFALSVFGADGTIDPLTLVGVQLKEAIAKETKKIEMLPEGSQRGQKLPFQEKISESGEVAEKSVTTDVDHYKFKTNTETNFVGIFRFDSIEDSTAAMNRFISQMPIQPPISMPGMGDAAVRFPGRTPERTGSLFFRRGTILVQINGDTARMVKKMARLIDQAIFSAKNL
jgi:hypothetical protein